MKQLNRQAIERMRPLSFLEPYDGRLQDFDVLYEKSQSVVESRAQSDPQPLERVGLANPLQVIEQITYHI